MWNEAADRDNSRTRNCDGGDDDDDFNDSDDDDDYGVMIMMI